MRLWIAAALGVGLAVFAGLAAAHPRARTTREARSAAQEATFTLINASCASNQVQIGRGCWDQNAVDKTKWAVHDGTATWTEPDYNATYTWKVPGQIPPSGGDVSMAVQANDVSNGSGVDVRICFLQSYNRLVSKGGGDKCAEAFAQGPPPSTKSASTEAILLSGGVALQGACPGGGFGCVTLELSLGDGGNVFYTYRASAAKHHTVSYSFSGKYKYGGKYLVTIVAMELQGLGTLEFNGSTERHSAEGQNLTGLARLSVRYGASPNVVHDIALEPTRARYSSPNVVVITYRVTSSGSRCLTAHRQWQISIVRFKKAPANIHFDRFCGATRTRFTERSETVHIKST